MVHHEAAVLHDVDAGAGEGAGEVVVADAALQPHGGRSQREERVEVRGEVLGAAKDVHEVDGSRDLSERTVHGRAEDLVHLGLVQRHRRDRDPYGREGGGHIVRGAVGEAFGPYAQHRHAAQPAHQGAEVIVPGAVAEMRKKLSAPSPASSVARER